MPIDPCSTTIESASIDIGEAGRDEHLRSPDFFDVEQYPELRFARSAVRRAEDGGLIVTGDLTIRDVTRGRPRGA